MMVFKLSCLTPRLYAMTLCLLHGGVQIDLNNRARAYYAILCSRTLAYCLFVLRAHAVRKRRSRTARNWNKCARGEFVLAGGGGAGGGGVQAIGGQRGPASQPALCHAVLVPPLCLYHPRL